LRAGRTPGLSDSSWGRPPACPGLECNAGQASGATTLECDVRSPVFAGEIPHCGRQFSLDGPLAARPAESARFQSRAPFSPVLRRCFMQNRTQRRPKSTRRGHRLHRNRDCGSHRRDLIVGLKLAALCKYLDPGGVTDGSRACQRSVLDARCLAKPRQGRQRRRVLPIRSSPRNGLHRSRCHRRGRLQRALGRALPPLPGLGPKNLRDSEGYHPRLPSVTPPGSKGRKRVSGTDLSRPVQTCPFSFSPGNDGRT
jgi:hypothetical protein